ncbi:MAG: membrane protein insertase YidC [Deltaproteobacteria bacterium]|nr:membrane protein insertase YidC [Deltaproteobacteria bacterium]
MDSSAARTFLAVVLSMAVILLWQMYIASKYPQRTLDVSLSDGGVGTEGELKSNKTVESGAEEKVVRDESSQISDFQRNEEFEEKTIILSNDFFEAIFTNKGGKLKSFELKKYYLARSPHKRVSLIEQDRPSLSLLLSSKLGKFTGEERYDFSEVSDKKIVFEHISQIGVKIVKEYTIIGNYEVLLKVRILNETEKDFIFKPSLVLADFALKGGLSKEDLKSSFEEYYYPICLANESIHDGKDLKGGGISKSFEGKINWLASTSRYFISAVLPVEQKISMCKFASDSSYNFWAELVYPEMKATQKNEITFSYKLYLGPKGYSMLRKVGADLERAVDFGWLAVLCIPLLYLLNFFNSFAHNYGISIIILTIVVKIISIPFTQKSMKSMQELQKLKPKLDELQKKYKDNREKLNEEMMKLYREHGVSPFGGCLPIILQMPIWFALYRMLSNSVELYQAVFIPGWINDLSSKDPYYILPILLGVGTYLQQKITPTTMDSTQAKIMLYFMPAFLTFIMISLPSGLTLYIFVSSLLSIIHQVYMNKKSNLNKSQPKSTREEEK